METVAVSNVAHCRTRHRKIDNEAVDVPAAWMQPPPSASMRPTARRGVKQMLNLASLDTPATESGRFRRHARWNEAGRSDCNSVGEGCEHNRPLQQSGCRARFRLERYLAGGRSGLSADFPAAGSRSGSSSQTRQT